MLPHGLSNVFSTPVTRCELPRPHSLSHKSSAHVRDRLYCAASSKPRLEVVIRDAVNNGDIPGPRMLANGLEMARRGAELVGDITAYANSPEEMREVIRGHHKIGVDQIKLSMSGEAITEIRSAEECFFSDEETAACVDEAHRNGLRVCAHARARDSVTMCVRHGVDGKQTDR